MNSISAEDLLRAINGDPEGKSVYWKEKMEWERTKWEEEKKRWEEEKRERQEDRKERMEYLKMQQNLILTLLKEKSNDK